MTMRPALTAAVMFAAWSAGAPRASSVHQTPVQTGTLRQLVERARRAAGRRHRSARSIRRRPAAGSLHRVRQQPQAGRVALQRRRYAGYDRHRDRRQPQHDAEGRRGGERRARVRALEQSAGRAVRGGLQRHGARRDRRRDDVGRGPDGAGTRARLAQAARQDGALRRHDPRARASRSRRDGRARCWCSSATAATTRAPRR